MQVLQKKFKSLQHGGFIGLILASLFILFSIVLKKVVFLKISNKGYYITIIIIGVLILSTFLIYSVTSKKNEQFKIITGNIKYINETGDTVAVKQAIIAIKQYPDLLTNSDQTGVYWTKLIGYSKTSLDIVISHKGFDTYHKKEFVDFSSDPEINSINFIIANLTTVKEQKEDTISKNKVIYDYEVVTDKFHGLSFFTENHQQISLNKGTKLHIKKREGDILYVVVDIRGKPIDGYMNRIVLDVSSGIGIKKTKRVEEKVSIRDLLGKEDNSESYQKYRVWMPEGWTLRFRTTKLSEKEIKQVNSGTNVYEESNMLALAPGTIVELIKTEGKWHWIKVKLGDAEYLGWVSIRFRGKPTLRPI